MDPSVLEEKSYADLVYLAKDIGLIKKGRLKKAALIKMLRKSIAPAAFKTAQSQHDCSSVSDNNQDREATGSTTSLGPAQTTDDTKKATVDVPPQETPRAAPKKQQSIGKTPRARTTPRNTPRVPCTPSRMPSTKAIVKARPTPNFARIHEKAFDKMESIDSYVARKQRGAAAFVSRIPKRAVAKKVSPKSIRPGPHKLQRENDESSGFVPILRERNRMVLGKVRSNRRFDLLLSHRGIQM
ncbi:nucleolar and spindle-associated protein 1-like [Ornithodoros turicata]|uniref:nucleolar and spindle-associated protein 1-like n=1 Tax=Ornithodoros turicata TaxID=34597 RepID=UPI0031394DA7